ncbi:MAG: hypothetical protein IPK25_09345 [Saprospiraceae bacterium]|nr:hypothetical protein [Saprospiraceae bacterium]
MCTRPTKVTDRKIAQHIGNMVEIKITEMEVVSRTNKDKIISNPFYYHQTDRRGNGLGSSLALEYRGMAVS